MTAPASAFWNSGAKARRLKAQQDVSLIIVDYLQLLRSTSRRAQDNRQLEISEISGRSQGFGERIEIPVIVVAQFKIASQNSVPAANRG